MVSFAQAREADAAPGRSLFLGTVDVIARSGATCPRSVKLQVAGRLRSFLVLSKKATVKAELSAWVARHCR